MGRGAQFRYVPIGGPVVGKLRSDLGSGDGQAVHLFKDASVSRFIVLRRRLGCVLSVLDGISENGLTLSRDLELRVGCDCFCWSLWSRTPRSTLVKDLTTSATKTCT